MLLSAQRRHAERHLWMTTALTRMCSRWTPVAERRVPARSRIRSKW